MKRSLHIGINHYPEMGSDLEGCINDANDWQEALAKREFLTTSLLDGEATKGAMVEALTKIVADTKRNDIAVITYSGHGTWVPDEDHDEADGRDEALCPYDIATGEVLIDDELHDIFSHKRWGARIIFISDSCHSGSVSRVSHFVPGVEGDSWKFPAIKFLPPESYLHNNRALLSRAKRVENQSARGKIRAASVLLSGCRDNEYSYDAWFNGRANGAFTYMALQALTRLSQEATYSDWYREIRKFLPHVNYSQTPQIVASRYQKNRWKVFEE